MRTLYYGIRIAECGIDSGKYQKLQVDAALDPVREIEGSAGCASCRGINGI
jgi:hypothetical protein